tara:strand:- start:301 stop:1455 length:1155 start_codon:yes stop_codon:yes gene_type:complete
MKQIYWLLIFIIWTCAGCTSFENGNTEPKRVILNDSLFSPVNPVTSEADLYQLTEQQQADFLHFYHQETDLGHLPHKIIRHFLESNLANFTYYGKTYTASEAMSKNSGNCMSLAILTTAFARLIDVDMDYRKIHSLPMYEKHGNIILSSVHVQSLLYDPSFEPEKNYVYIRRPAIIIDYFPQADNIPSKILNSDNFLAMYYVNKAAEFYIESDLDTAFAYAKRAYNIDHQSVTAMNLLALLFKRKGDQASAEQLYLAAIKSKDINISVLDNYIVLLKQQGRMNLARNVKRSIADIYDPNPYHWLEKAQSAKLANEYEDAERFYLKVIKLAPYVKQAYFELHEVYLLQDKRQLAIATLKQSLFWLHEPKQKRQYKKQLYQLSVAT